MRLSYTDTRTNGEIHFVQHEKHFAQRTQGKNGVFTIALNTGPDQFIYVDDATFAFPSWSVLPLFANQSFDFQDSGQIVAWQYNRDFYCIIDHDQEVSCAGFLFFGSFGNLFINLDETFREKLSILQRIFIEEMETIDSSKTDMLQMLLKRLIIITTRLAKSQHVKGEQDGSARFEVVRQYNLLVEKHFRMHHQVQFYANELNKSPKTLSNLFAQFNHKSPLYIIHERLVTEAKRLLYYSDKSAKEIAYELGFEDTNHFSRFFKNFSGENISEFKKSRVLA